MSRLKSILTILFLWTFALPWTPALSQEDGTIVTIAGGGSNLHGSGIPATDVQLNVPQDIAIDNDGNIYIADSFNHIIRRIDVNTGEITTFAGTGTPGFDGDNGPATDAELNFPKAVDVNDLGEVFIGDTNNFRIRRVDPVTGEITTFAGFGTRGTFPSQAFRVHPDSIRFGEITSILALNTALIIGEGINTDLGSGNNQILILRHSFLDSIEVFAGSGSQSASGDGGDAVNAGLTVEGLGLSSLGDVVYFADPQNHKVRSLTNDTDEDDNNFTRIDHVAGNGFTTIEGFGTFSGDGGPATGAPDLAPCERLRHPVPLDGLSAAQKVGEHLEWRNRGGRC